MSKSDVTKVLDEVLADAFVLYFKTHAFHWNVTGPKFKTLHEMFEEQYTDQWKALDEIAERKRTLGSFTANNPNDFIKGANIDGISQTPDADEMVKMLANDNREMSKTLKKAADIAADNEDPATEDLMIERIQAHDMAAWMLESSVDKAA